MIPSVVKSENSDTCSDDAELITIDNLRENEHLKSKVHKILKQLALTDDEQSNQETSVSDDTYSESDEKSDKESGAKKQIIKKKVKSGINVKAADRVKHPQRWPEAYLQFELVSKQLNYFISRNYVI